MEGQKSQRLHDLLQQHWGYSTFRPGQLEAIDSVTDGHDTLVLMPTGGGKSITFQVSGLYLGGSAVVVSPLIALMDDQIYNLRRHGIRATAIHSGQSADDQTLAINNAYSGQCAFIYVSPERLVTEDFKRLAASISVRLLVIDEAHCISQWGHDFRPDYRAIASFREAIPSAPCMAVTATATPRTADDIMAQLAFRHGKRFQNSFARPNLRYIVRPTFSKSDKLTEILSRVEGTAIVYCRNRALCDTYAAQLRAGGTAAEAYHAGLNAATRAARQEAWISGKTRVMVATSAFGMGIDKPDVRAVVHVEPPDSLEEYYQEAGRAGRDGEMSYAVLLYDSGDVEKLQQTLMEEVTARTEVERVYEAIMDYLSIPYGAQSAGAIPFGMSEFCKAKRMARRNVDRAFSILEAQGILSVNARDTQRVEVRMVVDPSVAERMLAAGSEEWRAMQSLMDFYPEIGGASISLRLPQVARSARMSQGAFVETLGKLSAMGFVRAARTKASAEARLLRPRFESGHFALDMAKLEQLNAISKVRAEGMLNYITDSTTCRSQLLCAYFGETNVAACGTCGQCIDRALQGKRLLERQRHREQIEETLRRGPIRLQELVSSFAPREPRFEETLRAMIDEGVVLRKRGGWLELGKSEEGEA